MKVITTELGRSTQLVIPDEVRPLANSYFPESVRLVTERYGFSAQPSYSDAVAAGAKFRGGRLIGANKKINITDLTIFSNGIQATATNTSDSDYILDDVIRWAESALGFRQSQTRLSRLHESHIVVDFERQVDALLGIFEKLRGDFATALAGAYGLRAPIALSGFSISADPLQVAAQLHPTYLGVLSPEFGLVRRLAYPYSGNRFFSTAPLRTEAHIALLEEFEKALPA
jgi:hypothetical protein